MRPDLGLYVSPLDSEHSMTAYRRRVLLNALKTFDILLAIVAVVVATYICLLGKSTPSLARFLSMRIRVDNFVLFAVLLFLWHVACSGYGLYNSRRTMNCRSDIRDAAKACLAGTAALAIAGLLFHVHMFSAKFLVVFFLFAAGSLVLSRVFIRMAMQYARKHGRNLRNLLIVGTGPRARQFTSTVESKPELGYRILGFVDQPWSGLDELRYMGYSILCDFDGLGQALRNNVVDEVVIALPLRTLHAQARNVALACELQGITVRVLSDLFDLRLTNVRADETLGILLITHSSGVTESWHTDAKRLFDITMSASLLLSLSPALVLIAILVKLSGPGPVLFSQSRVGLGKRRFNMYKFRTMVADAEQQMPELEHLNEVSGPVFKLKNDPRVTPIGKWLRKSSLDELPQLINVLKGEMSLVGPRPLPVRDYEGFNQDWQRRRFSVRPGLTCLWQIAGRSAIPFDKWMQLDLQYIDGWSLWLDVQILVRTLPVVVRGFGAF
jgi:exopolysaccharide biosynthesis polyprenyl glycosylphosphotransferase